MDDATPRDVSIFVSSTFRDMQLERDALRDIVLPRLRRFTEQYGVSAEFVDLRWGIDTVAADERKQTETILRVCKQEIDRCRPFFIALLGDRYGYVIPDDMVRPDPLSTVSQQTDSRSLSGKSATEIEIDHAMASGFPADSILPYIRLIRNRSSLGPELESRFISSGNAYDKQLDLKVRVRAAYPQMEQYWVTIDEDGTYDLHEFCTRILNDICARLHAQWGDPQPRQNDPVAMDIAQQHRFVSEFGRDFAGRDDLVTPLELFLDGDTKWSSVTLPDGTVIRADTSMLLLQGVAGSGRTCLTAKLASDMASHRYLVAGESSAQPAVILTAFGSTSDLTGRITDVLRTFCWQLEPQSNHRDTSGYSTAEIMAYFNGLLRDTCRTRRVLILIDALDKIGDFESWSLAWLGSSIPDNCAVLCTSDAGTDSDSRLRALHGQQCSIPALTYEDVRTIASSMCAAMHKRLPDRVLDVIALKTCAHPAASTPEYVSVLIDRLSVLGDEDYRRANELQAQGMTGIAALCSMMEERIMVMGDTPTNAYATLLDHVLGDPQQTDSGAPIIGDDIITLCVLIMLSVSPRGLREQDIIRIVQSRGIPFSSADFALIRQKLPGQFIRSGNGAWMLASDNLNDLLTRNYADEAKLWIDHAMVPYMVPRILAKDQDLFLGATVMFVLRISGDAATAAKLVGSGGLLADGSPKALLFGPMLWQITWIDQCAASEKHGLCEPRDLFIYRMIQDAEKLSVDERYWTAVAMIDMLKATPGFLSMDARIRMAIDDALRHLLNTTHEGDGIADGLLSMVYADMSAISSNAVMKNLYANKALRLAQRAASPEAFARIGLPPVHAGVTAAIVAGDLAWNSGKHAKAVSIYQSQMPSLRTLVQQSGYQDLDLLRKYTVTLIRILGAKVSGGQWRDCVDLYHEVTLAIHRHDTFDDYASYLIRANGYSTCVRYLMKTGDLHGACDCIEMGLLMYCDVLRSWPYMVDAKTSYQDMYTQLDLYCQVRSGDGGRERPLIMDSLPMLLSLYRQDPSMLPIRSEIVHGLDGQWGVLELLYRLGASASLMKEAYETEINWLHDSRNGLSDRKRQRYLRREESIYEDYLMDLKMMGMGENPQEPWTDGRSFPGTAKNAPCPCGSGRMYRMCHGINEGIPC